MARILGFGLIAILGVVGCAMPEQSKSSKGKQEGSEAPVGEEGTQQASGIKPTGDKADQDSPDTTFLAETYIRDLLETDDSEAFAEPLTKDEIQASSSGLALATADVDASASVDASTTSAAVAAAASLGVNVALPVPGDADPTEHDHKLFELITENIFSLADANRDGFLSQVEFVDTLYFGEGKLSAEALLKIKTRRAEWFVAIKGEAELVSPAEIQTFLAAGRKYVKALRIMRYLPYADHLAKEWAAVKAKYDANGDGKVDEAELALLRQERLELMADRRTAAMAGSYQMCANIIKNSGTLPSWFSDIEDKWSSILDVKPAEGSGSESGESVVTKMKNKLAGLLGTFNVSVSVDANVQAGGVSKSVSASASAGSALTGSIGESEDEVGPCQSILHRADAFGLADKLTALLNLKVDVKKP